MTWVDRAIGLAAVVALVPFVVMALRGGRRWLDVRADRRRHERREYTDGA